jgi:hypothetical protein
MLRPSAWRTPGSAAVIALLCCGAGPGHAQSPVNQPPLDLGQTSFLDGEGGPGFTFETIGFGSVAGYATDASGRAVPGRNRQWSGNITLHPIYVSKLQVLGGNLGFELLQPLSLTHLEAPGSPNTTQGGAGDLVIGPHIQWSGGSLFGRPFSSRLALQGVLPSGSYSARRPVNAGSDVWQISPYYAFTWKPFEAWEFSARLIYDWSSRSTNPSPRLGAGSVQPGSQFAVNYAVSYAVSPTLRLGVAGYALKQLNDTEVGGKPVPRSQQQAFGLGPGLVWTDGKAKVIANVFREFATENRPEGFSAVARLLYSF